MRAGGTVAYVLPFAVFIALLALMPRLGLAPRPELALWLGILGVVLLTVSRPVIDLSVKRLGASVVVGVAVFAIWIAPDLLFPAWRESILFNSPLFGERRAPPAHLEGDALALALRAARAVILVPIIEELFWRAWLPRWIIHADFRRVPLGTYTPLAFWATALLFALEHGRYWDVGLAAGVIYNAWMWRTRSLGDCILAHAVTNACLALYVIAFREWQYW